MDVKKSTGLFLKTMELTDAHAAGHGDAAAGQWDCGFGSRRRVGDLVKIKSGSPLY